MTGRDVAGEEVVGEGTFDEAYSEEDPDYDGSGKKGSTDWHWGGRVIW